MPFSAEIKRTNPCCVLFLIDQSKSMDGSFGRQPGKKKSEGVADAINRLLQSLALKCSKSDGIRDYFHVGVLGYGNDVKSLIGSDGTRALQPISSIANSPSRVELRQEMVDDDSGGLVEESFRFPVWFEPAAKGKTPMNAAVEMAYGVVQDFLATYPDCFPPLVMNLTDGEPTDANPLAAANALKSLQSSDGNVLFFNAHLSTMQGVPIAFPGDETNLPDKFSKLLFRMSSRLPPRMMKAAEDEGYAVHAQSRGFMFNADMVSVIRFLEIGTRVAASIR
jgi:uncharacterized protein YegL